MNQTAFQVITDRIIGLLEKNVVPWQKPWTSAEQAPKNLISKKPYRGINVFLLSSLNYSSPFFLTYKQAAELGGNVRRGEKGCPIVFWRWIDAENKETGEKQRIPFLRYFAVFNAAAQCDGLGAHIPAISQPDREHSPIEAAKRIVEAMPKRPEIRHGLNQAFYSPSGDYIGMPNFENFTKAEHYYSTVFHELGHSTGHASRLNRKGITGSEGQWSSFGSDSYSREELVAEMCSSFLCAEAEILERTIDNSTSYLKGWIQALKEDSKLVVYAAAQAAHAAEFILNRKEAQTIEVQPQAMAA